MRILNRYIAWHVITAILTVILAFVGILSFIQLLQEFRLLGRGDYQFFDAIYYTLLVLPKILYEIFPIVGLIGTLFGLTLLTSRNEIVVMQAAGVSHLKLIWSVMRAGLMVVIVMTIIGETAAPAMREAALNYKTIKTSGGSTYRTYSGTWLRSDNSFIYINRISGEGYLTGITEYAFNDEGEMYLSRKAKEGFYQDGDWLLKGVVESHISTTEVIRKEHPTLDWNVKLTLEMLNLASLKSDQLSLLEMRAYIKQLRSNGLETLSFEIQFWNRIFRPLSIAVMLFLAIPFIFGSQRNARTGARLTAGIAIGALFYIVNEFLGSFSLVYQIPPIIASLIPIVLFFIIGTLLLFRRL